jgi:hypothetical protein
MSTVIDVLKQRLSSEGKGILVLQDGYYKDLKIPLSLIIIEMMENRNLKAEIIGQEEIRANMRSLNPNHLKNEKPKSGNESVVYFEHQ